MPEWFLDEPDPGPLYGFWMQSFRELSTARRFAEGPIPWDATLAYAGAQGLDPEATELFCACVRAMDDAWLGWQSEQRERRMKRGGDLPQAGDGKPDA